MSKIVAFKKEKYRAYKGSELPMCSFSETDEVFVVDESKYEYILPDGFHKFHSESTNSIPIVCIENGKENVLGYAAKAYFVVGGNVHDSMEECMNNPLFHPADYVICNKDNVDKIAEYQREMIDNECYGD
jgi:hypothetical protein